MLHYRTIAARLKTVCAWCHLTMCEGPEPISHGICAACAELLENGGTR